ncbi:helix-turn-helix domain-containing protein [Methylobacterium sp. V23]|nr:helix-turn-helix domain-containing protein [Methylobacterium sp. V23]
MKSTTELSREQEQWLPGPQVDKRYGISAMSRWRWMHDPKLGFPAPTIIRRRTFWRLSDLIDWEQKMSARLPSKMEAA